MKKILLATSAITAVSLAGIASAQESQMMSAGGNTLSIGGYYEFGYTSLSSDIEYKNGGDSKTYGDSELYIDFETTSDSGLTYGVQIDLEIVNGSSHAESGGAKNAEEASIYVSGDFGTMHFGHDDNAYGRFQTWAPTHEGATSQDDNILYGEAVSYTHPGDNASSKSDDTVIEAPLARSAAGQIGAYEDNAKVAYVSPNFSGFSFGASVADSDSSADNPTAFGVSYNTDLAGFSIGLTGSMYDNNRDGTGTINDIKTEAVQYGVTLGAGDATFTVARLDGDSSFKDAANIFGHGKETDYTGEIKVTEFGIGYQITDSLAIGASLADSETDVDGKTSTGTRLKGEWEGEFRSVSGSYTIAPGLKTTLAFNQSDISDKQFKASNDTSEITWQLEFAF